MRTERQAASRLPHAPLPHTLPEDPPPTRPPPRRRRKIEMLSISLRLSSCLCMYRSTRKKTFWPNPAWTYPHAPPPYNTEPSFLPSLSLSRHGLCTDCQVEREGGHGGPRGKEVLKEEEDEWSAFSTGAGREREREGADLVSLNRRMTLLWFFFLRDLFLYWCMRAENLVFTQLIDGRYSRQAQRRAGRRRRPLSSLPAVFREARKGKLLPCSREERKARPRDPRAREREETDEKTRGKARQEEEAPLREKEEEFFNAEEKDKEEGEARETGLTGGGCERDS